MQIYIFYRYCGDPFQHLPPGYVEFFATPPPSALPRPVPCISLSKRSPDLMVDIFSAKPKVSQSHNTKSNAQNIRNPVNKRVYLYTHLTDARRSQTVTEHRNHTWNEWNVRDIISHQKFIERRFRKNDNANMYLIYVLKHRNLFCNSFSHRTECWVAAALSEFEELNICDGLKTSATTTTRHWWPHQWRRQGRLTMMMTLLVCNAIRICNYFDGISLLQ